MPPTKLVSLSTTHVARERADRAASSSYLAMYEWPWRRPSPKKTRRRITSWPARPKSVATLQSRRKKNTFMNTYLLIVIIFVAVAVALWLISFVFEALRPVPQTPTKLLWPPEIAISCIDIDGSKIRYVKAGQGPSLLLLHTLRTQLDLFEKVIPELSKHFTVYAVDYPGHGYSDIPEAAYDADFFAHFVES